LNYLDSKILFKTNQEIKLISNNLGDRNVLIHSDIKNLFLFKFKSKTDLLEKHFRNINEIFSKFNIWMPTFNYDFTKTSSYNLNKDKSQVGVLNDYFRNICDWRTTTPVFNFCGNGKYPIEKIYPNCVIKPFSYGSEFDYLYKTKSLHCHYGSNISHSTLFHFVENISNRLLYRYSKLFKGVVYHNGDKTNVFLDYHVSPLNPRVEYDWHKIYCDLIRKKLIFEFKIFEDVNYITLFSIKDVSDYWINKLNKDYYYFLSEESKKWVIPKINKLGRGFELNDFE
jgi:aminoglycoside N3'-acetyltransferase